MVSLVYFFSKEHITEKGEIEKRRRMWKQRLEKRKTEKEESKRKRKRRQDKENGSNSEPIKPRPFEVIKK